MSTDKQHFLLVQIKGEGEHIEFDSKVVSFEGNEQDEKLSFFRESIGCQWFDIVAYSEVLDLVVNDEGLMISGNPVFDFPNDMKIAGSFLVGRQLMTEEGVNTVGFDSVE